MHDAAYAKEAIARARTKLRELRSGRVVARPAGRFRERIVHGALRLFFGVILLGSAPVLLAHDGDRLLGAILVLAGALAAALGSYRIVISRASCPENALLLFFSGVGSGRYAEARCIVVPNDRDDFRREYPRDPDLGPGGGYGIGSPDGFANYWKGLLRNRLAPYCRTRIEDIHVSPDTAPDVAIVDFRLTVTSNTWLSLLPLLALAGGSPLGFLGVLLTVICLGAMHKRETARMRKIVWCVGDEWHLFNGEWQGPEERDTGWLEEGRDEREVEVVPEHSYAEEAIRRARRKLAVMRGGNVVHFRAGPFWRRIAFGGFLVAVGLVFTAATYAMVPEKGSQRADALRGVWIVGGASLAVVAPGVLLLLTSTATSPKRALTLFYKSVARGNMRAARRLVVPIDLDRFPRRFPGHPALGHSGKPPYAFGLPAGFDDYWENLVRYPDSPYCLVGVRNLRVRAAETDMAIAEFRLKLAINTSTWLLLLFLGVVPGIIMDLATRKRVNEPMRKILVRVGDEWHLFSGEWQGPEETDTSWLEGMGGGGR